jgi:hypothetical protein
MADDTMDTDFLDWLGKTVGDALLTAEQHESLKGQVRELRAAVENRFSLIAIQVRVLPIDKARPSPNHGDG